ncbi:phospholipase D-like domain-containing protein [Thalassospira lucentensis]|uniref:phospholipase D-like domain-containing protein n=1 Tax=Thalassospira lucentensis TaxID=168935 RepID=UPI003D2EAB05
MQVTRANSNAQFLLDGNAYFARLHQSLDGVIAAGAGANRFVRMAFWQIAPDAFLPGYGGGAGALLVDKLEAIARLSIRVEIIAWAGAQVLNNFVPEMKSGWQTRAWVQEVNRRNNALGGYRPIEIYMESYGRRTFGMSTHQKIVVLSTGPLKEAYVGGMNMAHKYLSSDIHDPENWWHDAAVRVTGQIVDDIEGEWVRRWNKQTTLPAPAATIGVAAPDPANLTITMMTTNSEAIPAERDIRAGLQARIGAAANYVYLENYALTDPSIVEDLAAFKQGGGTVIPVVNHPANKTMDGFEGFSYLMYYTYVELALADLNAFDAADSWRGRAGPLTNYPAANVVGAHVDKAGYNPANMATLNPATAYRVTFNTAAGVPTQIGLRYIWDIAANNDVMFAPKTYRHNEPTKWTYPHSKLAIIDDQYVMVGTSNWTYRSMQYDGEITLEIDDAAFAQGVRAQLFTHWHMPTAAAAGGAAGVGAAWLLDATANQVAWAGGNFALSETRLVPCAFDDFMHPISIEAWKNSLSSASLASIGSSFF